VDAEFRGEILGGTVKQMPSCMTERTATATAKLPLFEREFAV
jgi:hypothetical protein